MIDGLQDRWSEAVQWLQAAQSGDARGVLDHRDVPGRIDLIWGHQNIGTDVGYGLAHIVAKHPEVLPDLPERMSRMRAIERRGNKIVLASDDGRERAVIASDFAGHRKTWLLTAYEEGRSGGGVIEGAPGSRGPNPGSSGRPADENVASAGAIDNTHEVVSGANSARDPNGPVYIDRRIPEFSPVLKDKTDAPVNLWKYLSLHERTEAEAMREGVDYKRAHEDIATPAERAAVEADGVDWAAYTYEIDGYLDHIEHEKADNPPPEALHVDPQAAIGAHRAANKGAAGPWRAK